MIQLFGRHEFSSRESSVKKVDAIAPVTVQPRAIALKAQYLGQVVFIPSSHEALGRHPNFG